MSTPPSPTQPQPATSRIPRRASNYTLSHSPPRATSSNGGSGSAPASPRHASSPVAPHTTTRTTPSTPTEETRERHNRRFLPLHIAPHQHHHHHHNSPRSTSSPSPSSTLPSPIHSTAPSSPSYSHHTHSPRKCSRPKLDYNSRTCSTTTYSSFPLQPPHTPGDDVDERENGFMGNWWGWWRRDGHGEGDLESLRERERLVGSAARAAEAEVEGPATTTREGLPKLSRECLVAEIKCYGTYMLPPMIVFVGIALTIALYTYGKSVNGRDDNNP